MPAAWREFVDGSLQRLQNAALLRRLHPLQPSLDPMQASMLTILRTCMFSLHCRRIWKRQFAVRCNTQQRQ